MVSSWLQIVRWFIHVQLCALVVASAQHVLAVVDVDGRPRLNFSSSAPHLVAALAGVLQEWPNTFFPMGHSIVPCEVPAFTKLYHGRINSDAPTSPEWLALDVEMSYGIMGSTRSSHILTYQTTRPIRCVYFDGESANFMDRGQMATQMLHIWGNLTGPPTNERGPSLSIEYARAQGLCDWFRDAGLGGPGWGYEGIVRMNAGFEMIWCDFDSPSIRLVSQVNVTAPLLQAVSPAEVTRLPLPSPTWASPAPPVIPPNWRLEDQEPFLRSQGWEWFESATWHYAGEDRLKPLACGFLSYYASDFAAHPEERERLNLTAGGFWKGAQNRTRGLQELTRRRRAHTLTHIAAADAARMKTKSVNALAKFINSSTPQQCSGVDWVVMAREIIQRHARGLMNFNMLLSTEFDSKNETATRLWLREVRDQSHVFLVPFLDYSQMSREETLSRCQYHHTRLLVPEEGIFLDSEEQIIAEAVEEVMGGICSVLIDVGLGVEQAWSDLTLVSRAWLAQVEELMAWLGWADKWVKCERVCDWDEICFIPMWPVLKQRDGHGGPGGPRGPGGPGGPGRYGKPGRGPGRRPDDGHGRDGYSSFPAPDWMTDETDLWAPKCVKTEYIMG